MSYKLTALVKTLSGTASQALGSGLIPSDAWIAADSTQTIYIGGDANVSSSTGFLLPTTPLKLSSLLQGGHTQDLDLAQIFVIGADTNKVRVLYISR